MKSEEGLLFELICAFKVLPGVGEKTAQRMAFHLLEKNREGAKKLAATISRAIVDIHNCEICSCLLYTSPSPRD